MKILLFFFCFATHKIAGLYIESVLEFFAGSFSAIRVINLCYQIHFEILYCRHCIQILAFDGSYYQPAYIFHDTLLSTPLPKATLSTYSRLCRPSFYDQLEHYITTSTQNCLHDAMRKMRNFQITLHLQRAINIASEAPSSFYGHTLFE